MRRRELAIAGAAALLVAALDAALLQRKASFFTGGFLAERHVDGAGSAALFVGLSALCNAALTLPLTAAGHAIARRCRLSVPASAFLELIAAAGPLLAATFVNYQLWTYLGDSADLGLLFQLTGRHVSEFFAVGAGSAAGTASAIAIAIIVVGLATWAIHAATRRSFPAAAYAGPDRRRSTALMAMLALAASTVVTASALESSTFDYGLRHVASARLFGTVIDRLTDVDRDGYGLLRFPRDSAPFDAAIHPYAIDIPGDGIDQDGIAGDLPAAQADYREPAAPSGTWGHAPSVILIVLESVRADAVGTMSDGKAVTPNLDALARSGISVPYAYSHNGYTVQSRFHILTGSLANVRGGTTIIDDFHARGYETAYFSAQDDSFGGSPIDFHSCDVFYDARSDRERRFSAFATPGSLALPHEIIEERIHTFLMTRRTDRPVFMYVNFQDTHYPYHHQGMQALLNDVVLAPDAITETHRADLRRMYLNAVGNVDAAIGRVIRDARTTLGDVGVIVISDHGESLFDSGFLGHGYALNDAQTRIPLVVSGLPMRIPQPFGQVSLRDTLAAAMDDASHGVKAAPQLAPGDARVFQYLGTVDRPAAIAWTTTTGRETYDFRTDSFDAGTGGKRPAALSGRDLALFHELIYYWESMRWAAARSADPK